MTGHTCGAEQALFGVQCGLAFGHDGPHEHHNDGERITWEPNYVAELRRRVDDAMDLLREVANSGVSFEDDVVDWVDVQIDRATWSALADYREANA